MIMKNIRQSILDETEKAISLGKARAKKTLKEFERLVSPWVMEWDGYDDALKRARLLLSGEEQREFDMLLKAFNDAGRNLSVFLRSRRLDLIQKGK